MNVVHCETCGKSLHRDEIAASVTHCAVSRGGDVEQVWCMPCWDADDDNALNQYRLAGVPALPQNQEDGDA